MEERIYTRKDVEGMLKDLEARRNNIPAKNELLRIKYSAIYSLYSMYLQVMTQQKQDYLILDIPTSIMNVMFGRVKTKRKVKK